MKAYIYECITVEMCEAIHEFMCAYECECMNEGKYKHIIYYIQKHKCMNVRMCMNEGVYKCVCVYECMDVWM